MSEINEERKEVMQTLIRVKGFDFGHCNSLTSASTLISVIKNSFFSNIVPFFYKPGVPTDRLSVPFFPFFT
jgi:hypothetical protein